jgi:hypothetical protein
VERLCRYKPGNTVGEPTGDGGLSVQPSPSRFRVHWWERLSTIQQMPEMKGSGETCDGEFTYDEGRMETLLPHQPSTLPLRNGLDAPRLGVKFMQCGSRRCSFFIKRFLWLELTHLL